MNEIKANLTVADFIRAKMHKLEAQAALGRELAEMVLAVDASGKRDIPERVCNLARKFKALAGEKGE